MMEQIAPMIATVVMMLVILWITQLVSTNRRLDRLAKMHNELQHQILDKFSTTEEVIEYLGTDAGKRLLDAPVIEPSSPYSRILGSVQAGIIITLVGLGFLVVRGLVDATDQFAVTFTGALCVGLGVGFLVSAYASHVLSKSYGLINGRRSGAET